MSINNNWILKKYNDYIQPLSNDFREKFTKFKIPIIGYGTFIDWDKILPNYSFMYDYEGNKFEITSFLKQSVFADYQHIILYIDLDLPLIAVDTQIFINNWEDFVASNGYTGIIAFTDDGKYFAEFTDDSQWRVYSNFPIKTHDSDL